MRPASPSRIASRSQTVENRYEYVLVGQERARAPSARFERSLEHDGDPGADRLRQGTESGERADRAQDDALTRCGAFRAGGELAVAARHRTAHVLLRAA